MNPQPLSLLVLRVADLERAAEFCRVLGFDFAKHAHGKGPEHFAAEAHRFVFELYPATAEQGVSSSARIGFAVDDVDAVAIKLSGIDGAKMITPPKSSEWGRRAVVSDPNGHRVELTKARVDL